MRSILAATAVGLAPLTALAGPIQDYDFLTVHYEGTVNSVKPFGPLGFGDGASVPDIGDRVSGSLRVNLHEVPRDNFPDDPRRGEYSASLAKPSYTWPSFVSGHAEPLGGPSGDRLQIQDNIGGRDLFEVVDQEVSSALGPFDFRASTDALYLMVSSTRFDFIHGDGPLQSFEINADQLDLDQPYFGETMHSKLEPSAQDWFGGTVGFAIGKLTVKPGRCSP
jgi:hypothetical protein